MFKFSDILGACDWDSDWDNSDWSKPEQTSFLWYLSYCELNYDGDESVGQNNDYVVNDDDSYDDVDEDYGDTKSLRW